MTDACPACLLVGQHKMGCSMRPGRQLSLPAIKDGETFRLTFIGPPMDQLPQLPQPVSQPLRRLATTTYGIPSRDRA